MQTRLWIIVFLLNGHFLKAQGLVDRTDIAIEPYNMTIVSDVLDSTDAFGPVTAGDSVTFKGIINLLDTASDSLFVDFSQTTEGNILLSLASTIPNDGDTLIVSGKPITRHQSMITICLGEFPYVTPSFFHSEVTKSPSISDPETIMYNE